MATLKDIAQAAGVSAMTVSRYFNEPDKLKPKTFEKIKAIVEELEYEPNMVARLLATKRTHIICVYIAEKVDDLHPFTLQAIAGIGEELGEHGYSMNISKSINEKIICDGIISIGLSTKKENKLLEMSKDKVVLFFGNSSYEHNWIDVDNYKGSYIATEYLIKQGYRKIGNIGVEESQSYASDRYKAYIDCMKEHGLIIPKNGVTKVHNDEFSGYEGAKQVLENADVDALVCASDALALGAVRYANEHDISIPDDLGVIGFDGLGYEKLVSPTITTMQQPVYAAGKKVAQIMMDILDNNLQQPTETFIEPVLVVNETTK